jgi:hypothetical protein
MLFVATVCGRLAKGEPIPEGAREFAAIRLAAAALAIQRGGSDPSIALRDILKDTQARAQLHEVLGKISFGNDDGAEFRHSRLAELRETARGNGFIAIESLAMGERLRLQYQKRVFGGMVRHAEIEVARTVGASDNDQLPLTVMSRSGDVLTSDFTSITLEPGVTVGLGYWDDDAGRAGEFYSELVPGTQLATVESVRQSLDEEQRIQDFDLYSDFTLQQAYYDGEPLFPEQE